jgi:glycosyltransferase involved in cell wall biosynthesis
MTSQPTSWPQNVFVLIPAYKAQEELRTFLPSLRVVVPASHVLVVDDGSKDQTFQICADNDIRCLVLPINRGKGAALQRGFDEIVTNDHARFIITMDADGQHAISDLSAFLLRIAEDPQSGIIIGKRAMKLGTMPPERILSNKLTSALLSIITMHRIRDSQCGYRAYSTALLHAVRCSFHRFEMESEVIIRACVAGFSVSFINVQTLYLSTQSHISHVADTLRWLWAVVTVWITVRRTKRTHV